MAKGRRRRLGRPAAGLLLVLVGLGAGPPACPHDGAGDPLPRFALGRLGTTRWRHHWIAAYLAATPDGKTLVITTPEEGVYLVDAATGLRRHRLLGPAAPRQGSPTAAISADGGTVAVAREEESLVQLLDPATGKELARLETHAKAAKLAVSRRGELVARVLPAGDLRVWETKTGRVRFTLGKSGTCFCFSPGGKLLYCGGSKNVLVASTTTGRSVRRLDGAAQALAVSADGRTLAVYGRTLDTPGRGWIQVWDTGKWKVRRTLKAPQVVWPKFALSANGGAVALGGSAVLRVWDTATGDERWRAENHGFVTGLVLAPDGGTVTWGRSNSPLISRWDLKRGRTLAPCPGHGKHVEGLAFSPDGQELISHGADGLFRWKALPWRAGKQAAVRWEMPWGRSRYGVRHGAKLVCSPDGKLLAVPQGQRWGRFGKGADMRRGVELRDARTGKLIRTLAPGFDRWECVAFSPNGKLLAVGGAEVDRSNNEDGSIIRLWEARSGRLLHALRGDEQLVTALAFSPDGRTLAAAGYEVVFWDVKAGKRAPKRKGPRQACAALALSADGRTLFAAGEGLAAWDVREEVETWRQGGQSNSVTTLALSPTGKLLAVGDGAGGVRLHDARTGAEVAALAGHARAVAALAFAPGGKMLASGSVDTTILLWDVSAALAGAARPAGLSLAARKRLWADLARADAAAGQKAVWALVADPARAVPFIRDALPPAVSPARVKRIKRLVEQLDSDVFAERESAEEQLRKLGEVSVPALREGLRRARPRAERSLEFVRRAKGLLADLDPPGPVVPAGHALRAVRAVQVLELIGSAEARAVLKALAARRYADRLVLEARRALGRLADREDE
jgi:WD40 repeat protein